MSCPPLDVNPTETMTWMTLSEGVSASTVEKVIMNNLAYLAAQQQQILQNMADLSSITEKISELVGNHKVDGVSSSSAEEDESTQIDAADETPSKVALGNLTREWLQFLANFYNNYIQKFDKKRYVNRSRNASVDAKQFIKDATRFAFHVEGKEDYPGECLQIIKDLVTLDTEDGLALYIALGRQKSDELFSMKTVDKAISDGNTADNQREAPGNETKLTSNGSFMRSTKGGSDDTVSENSDGKSQSKRKVSNARDESSERKKRNMHGLRDD